MRGRLGSAILATFALCLPGTGLGLPDNRGGGKIAPGPHASQQQLVIVNESHIRVAQLYVSSPSDDEWGKDRLGEHALAVTDSVTLTLAAKPVDLENSFDLLLIDSEEEICALYDIPIPDDRVFTLTAECLLECQSAREVVYADLERPC